MLLDLLFGTYRQRALAQLLLHPESGYHVRELARLTCTTPGAYVVVELEEDCSFPG